MTSAPAERSETAWSFVLAPIDEEDEEVLGEEVDASAANGASPVVVAEMTTDLPRLTVGEAVMRMELADHMVLMFRDVNSGVLNVVYRRTDGNIGWIDPGD